ncbi:hypothetical protein ACSG7X_000373 [Vibrio fluvialis]
MKAIFEFKNEQFEVDLDFPLPESKELEVQLTEQIRVKNIELQDIDLSSASPIFRYKCQQVKKRVPVSETL